MKLILILVVLSLQFTSYCQKAASYKIVGHIKGMPDQKIYLDYYEKGIKDRDTTISKNGDFEFTGTVSEPVFANIHHHDGHGEIELFLDNSLWKITGTYENYNAATVSCSVIDAQWKKYFQKDQELVLTSRKVKGNDDLLQRRKDLLKNYVKEYRNSHAGALIPNFCTIERNLSHDDWVEIYRLLSTEMKETYYGKKIRAKVEGDLRP